jgi:hypothetical protein
MSNLLVQNIKHTNNTSAQTIDTSGRTTALLNNDTTYRSDSGAVTQNMVQGLCKAWSYYTTASSFTNHDSLNVSSLTDRGTGDCRLVFTNVFASVNRPQHGMSGSRHFSDGDSSASFANFVSADGSNNQEDGARSSGMVSGDLA